MLASPTRTVPAGEQWQHEVKWDGLRTLLTVTADDVRLVSRNGNPITAAWPELAVVPAALAGAGAGETVLDGEIIALNDRGLPDFRVLADRMHVRRPSAVARLATQVPATLMVFDVLHLRGRDLCRKPLAERRRLLEGLELAEAGWQVPAVYDDGAMLLEATCIQGLEGVVSKRRDSAYRPGERSPHWLKLAHRHRGTYVVGGWRPQVGTRDRLASLLVGEVTDAGLAYRGRVGSGISAERSRVLAELLAPVVRSESPFVDAVPREDAAGTTWVDPVVVVDVDTHGRGYQRLRQPSFQGVRLDVTPADLADGSEQGGA